VANPAAAVPIASFKLQFASRRVRVVPALDRSGCPFTGPGVDLLLDETDAIFDLARPLLAWLEAREPVRVRSLSLDIGRRRLLVTIEPIGATAETGADAAPSRPRVVKIDASANPGDSAAAQELVDLAGPLIRRLGEIAASKLAAREKP
jgi:hypothetical protein